MQAPLPPDEKERLETLQSHKILDTAPDQEFDDITLLASQICGTPMAMISLVDENRQWFKSKVGTTESETSRNIAFCAHGILQDEVFVINDARADKRFAANPLVTGNPGIRFYAGVPLTTSSGHALGMLCVNDRVPRELSAEQQTALRALSRQVVTQLELRRTATALRETIGQLKRVEEELKRGITAREQATEALRESEEKFRQLADNVADVFWMTSPDLKQVLYVSPAYERVWGRSAANASEHPQEWADAILPEDREHVFATFGRLMADKASVNVEFRITRPDGEVRRIYSRGFQVRDAAGKVIRLTGIASDITERREIEAKVFQSQKVETVGKLAGGVAHEFNSILTAIIGQSELLLGDLPPGSSLIKNATEISQAAGRAATLTRQLLAYGRKQNLRPEILDLNKVIVGMAGMFQQVMGNNVDTQIVSGVALHPVKADAGQIEQVIMNMAMNARDAMPYGGKLMLETANVSFDHESVGRYPELKAGDYVMLAITDTGAGMGEKVKARLFEPFFSTKPVGQGTGLGLSTCYGIAKQSGGHISVYSEIGRGTAFKIYLPRMEQQAQIPIQRVSAVGMPRGTETILLVEDDPALREMASGLLGRLGYKVLVAANGIEALSLKQQPGTGHVDLLFTDVVMPHMSGKELADRVQALYPHTRILFTSAYTENSIVHQGVLNMGVAFLQKPFAPFDLAQKLREVLSQPFPVELKTSQ